MNLGVEGLCQQLVGMASQPLGSRLCLQACKLGVEQLQAAWMSTAPSYSAGRHADNLELGRIALDHCVMQVSVAEAVGGKGVIE